MIFTLKNINPDDFKVVKSQPHGTKTKYDIYNPGKISHVTNSGGIIRVLQRGEICDKTGGPYDRECGKPCWWHRQSFDGLAMGIPIRIYEKKVYMDGIFCSYSCVYAFLLDHLEKVVSKRDPNYKNSIILLKQLFVEEFPGQILIPTPDWRLLKTVGNGSMTIKDLTQNLKGIRLIKHPNLIFVQVIVNYDII